MLLKFNSFNFKLLRNFNKRNNAEESPERATYQYPWVKPMELKGKIDVLEP